LELQLVRGRKAFSVLQTVFYHYMVHSFRAWRTCTYETFMSAANTRSAHAFLCRLRLRKSFSKLLQYTLRLRHLHHVSVGLGLRWTRINIAAAFATFKLVLRNAIDEVRLHRVAQAVALRTQRFSLRSWMSGWAWLAYRRRVM
jgi:hypothetical protein